MKLRLLHFLMILCIGLIAVRIGDMIDRNQSFSDAMFTPASYAEDKPPEKEKAEEKDGKEEEKSEGGHGEKSEEKKEEGGHGKSDKPDDTIKPAEQPVPEFNKTELEILQRLAERRKQLDEREKEVEAKEAVLGITEQKIEQKMKDLGKMKDELNHAMSKYDNQEDQRLKSLVKIYEGMKPKDAARIFNEMDTQVLLSLVEQMKESKLAPVLANMESQRAMEITTHLAVKAEKESSAQKPVVRSQ